MTPNLDPANLKRIETLKSIVTDLKAGKHFLITRLTPIKSLCKEPAAAKAFTKYLASMSAQTLVARPRPRHLSKEKWETFQQLAKDGLAAVEHPESNHDLRQLLTFIRDSQNVVEHQHWADVRLIECTELFQIEVALRCLLNDDDPPRLAYIAARHHAERYEPEYGTGLLPSSARALEQIVAFWDQKKKGKVKEVWSLY